MSKAPFLHALDLASIEVLDCDIPLNIGFDIQHYIKDAEYSWNYRGSYRGRIVYGPRLIDSFNNKNRGHEAKAPRYLNSNSGAGYR